MLFQNFQHPDRNTEDHGSICPSALLAWTAKAFCKLSRQSTWCLVDLKFYRTVLLLFFYFDTEVGLHGTLL